MDFETGEDYVDQETGEVADQGLLDSETGEIELIRKQPNLAAKKPFKVPPAYIKQSESCDPNKAATKRLVLTNASPFSPMIFLFPSVFFFMPIMACILAVVEMALHAWAHRKNSILRSNNINFIYFQSPMHGLISQFCAKCRYESTQDAIGKLQDKWNRRFFKFGMECVKQIA